MARGWESKAVADQIEEADQRANDDTELISENSPEVRARRERIESLKLSRSRILSQLESVINPRYRDVLSRSLSALEAEIDELS